MEKPETLIVGGLGYLGYNLASRFSELGYRVIIVSRFSSLRRWPRRLLYSELRRMPGVRVRLLPSLTNPLSYLASATRCPSIAVIAVGRLQGSPRSLVESNAVLPGIWAAKLLERCPETLVAYVSTILALGDPAACSVGGVVYEEEEHLEGCRPWPGFSESKAAGERAVLRACWERGRGRLVVLRAGLLVGEWSYHPEWLALYTLPMLGLSPAKLHLHLTPARRLADLLARMEADGAPARCLWVNAAPWRVDVGVLVQAFSKRRRVRLRFQLPRPLLDVMGGLPRKLSILSRYVYASRYVPSWVWGGMSEEVSRQARWLSEWWLKLSADISLPARLIGAFGV